MNNNKKTRKGRHLGEGSFHTLLGAVTALIGLFWLAHKLGWIPVTAGGSQLFWPILTIAVGLWIIYGSPKAKALHYRIGGKSEQG